MLHGQYCSLRELVHAWEVTAWSVSISIMCSLSCIPTAWLPCCQETAGSLKPPGKGMTATLPSSLKGELQRAGLLGSWRGICGILCMALLGIS